MFLKRQRVYFRNTALSYLYKMRVFVSLNVLVSMMCFESVSAYDDPIAALIRDLQIPKKPISQPYQRQYLLQQHPLFHFFNVLSQLEKKQRNNPVRILHLGDSHIVADLFSGDLREFFQKRFDNAGRGFLPPGIPDKYYYVRGAKVRQYGDWKKYTVYKNRKIPYGISGVKFSSTSSKSKMILETKHPFDYSEITFQSSSNSGKAIINIDGQETVFDTRGKEKNLIHFQSRIRGKSLSVRPKGDGKVVLLSWKVENIKPGIIYTNIGQTGVSADIMSRWDKNFIAHDIQMLQPDLIVLSYGTNEGFSDNLNIKRYKTKYLQSVNILKKYAPKASFIMIGAPGALRLPRYISSRKKKTIKGCRELKNQEVKNYKELFYKKDKRLSVWHPPPNLNRVRFVQKSIAKEIGAWFWDWSEVMQGNCGIMNWSRQNPAFAYGDFVHMTHKGARYSARLLFYDIMRSYKNQKGIFAN